MNLNSFVLNDDHNYDHWNLLLPRCSHRTTSIFFQTIVYKHNHDNDIHIVLENIELHVQHFKQL